MTKFMLSLVAMIVATTSNRTFEYTGRVARWADVVEEHTTVETAVVLALIHVESDGNAAKRRLGSEYRGLLQIGRALAADAGVDYDALEGNGVLSVQTFDAWYALYQDIIGNRPDDIALAWKIGIGAFEEYKQRTPGPETNQWLELERWGAWTYLQWFRVAYAIWSTETC